MANTSILAAFERMWEHINKSKSCYSIKIEGSLESGVTNNTHYIRKFWTNGIPIVRSVSKGTTNAATPIIYTVMDDDSNGSLKIRTQRPTGVANSAAVSYVLQIDVIKI